MLTKLMLFMLNKVNTLFNGVRVALTPAIVASATRGTNKCTTIQKANNYSYYNAV